MIETVRRISRGPGLAVGLAFGLAGGAALAFTASEARSPMADEETFRALAAVKLGIVAGHKARDRAALERLYADDYTAVDSEGIRTKAELLEGLATRPEMVEGKYDLLAARRWGNVAVAKGQGHFVYRNSDGSTRVVEYRSFNVFGRRGGRWLYAAAFLPDE